jgi:hypothetical protein
VVPDVISGGILFFLVWLFATAAVHKARAPRYYTRLVASYVPMNTGRHVLVWLICLGEGFIAVLLLLPGLHKAGLAAAALVLAGYAALMSWQVARGQTGLECGCAGPTSTLRVGSALIARNLACAILAALAMTSHAAFPAGPGSLVLALITAVLLITTYLACEQAIGNAQAMDEDI